MKVYLLFKVKDMTKKKKEYVVDGLYTTKTGALQREARLHGERSSEDDPIPQVRWQRMAFDLTGLYKTKHQQTYIINKTVKGEINAKKK